MKKCSRCHENKPAEDFHRQRKRSGEWGLQSRCKECMRAHKRAYAKANRDRVAIWDRRKMLRSRYGEDAWQRYEVLWEMQGGKCAICGKEERLADGDGRRTRLAMDHCHDTGKVRGLLCRSCNGLLGQLGDTEAGVRRFLDYVVTPVGYTLPDQIPLPPKWANEHERCTSCETTAVPHGGGGLCRNCYMRRARREGKAWAREERKWADRKEAGALTPSQRKKKA